MHEERIKKAIDFFRKFSDKADKDLYRRSVLKFCELVEEHMQGKIQKINEPDIEDEIQDVFGDVIEKGTA